MPALPCPGRARQKHTQKYHKRLTRGCLQYCCKSLTSLTVCTHSQPAGGLCVDQLSCSHANVPAGVATTNTNTLLPLPPRPCLHAAACHDLLAVHTCQFLALQSAVIMVHALAVMMHKQAVPRGAHMHVQQEGKKGICRAQAGGGAAALPPLPPSHPGRRPPLSPALAPAHIAATASSDTTSAPL